MDDNIYPIPAVLNDNVTFPPASVIVTNEDPTLIPFTKNAKLLTDVGGSNEPTGGCSNAALVNIAVDVVTVFAVLIVLVFKYATSAVFKFGETKVLLSTLIPPPINDVEPTELAAGALLANLNLSTFVTTPAVSITSKSNTTCDLV